MLSESIEEVFALWTIFGHGVSIEFPVSVAFYEVVGRDFPRRYN